MELRRAPRYSFRCPAHVREATVDTECALRNLSLLGCYVETQHPLTIGSTIDLLICVGEVKIRVRGKVRFADLASGMGVEFTHLNPAALFVLKTLIHEAFYDQRSPLPNC